MTDSFTLSTEVWVEAPGVGLIPQIICCRSTTTEQNIPAPRSWSL